MLKEGDDKLFPILEWRLNPYFNGTCSKRYKMALHKDIIGLS